ncbi:hypothetical protein [Haloechinothrix salitolerans]|uniref:Uncharacterized protein n=1 Tax=Haloechinothrix salitolerans TaxID=926830 RepID=A0ABW2C4U2_9PSEU
MSYDDGDVDQVAYSHRTVAMLRAVAAGRAVMTCSAEPDLFIDGLPCCDQFAAHELTHHGLVYPSHPGQVGQRVPARLTPTGLGLVAELTVTA